MNASELEQIWNRQEPVNPSPENVAQVAALVRAVDRKFRRQVWWRDLREVGVALILAGLCAAFGQTWLRWISVVSCLFVAGFIIRSRLVFKSPPETPSVIARLQQMVRETETQIKLLRSVLWWYLLPCGIATLALVRDHPPRKFDHSTIDLSYLLIFAGGFVALYIAVYWINQRVVRRTLEPRREQLRHALAELDPESVL
jgi:putative flippase GtrA